MFVVFWLSCRLALYEIPSASFASLFCRIAARADIVVLHDGTSYSGHYAPAGKTLSFTDNQGIHYDLPVGDVQSLVFSNAADHLTLRNGRTYSGQLNGNEMISFQGNGGIDYQFPVRDVSSLILTGSPAPVVNPPHPDTGYPRGRKYRHSHGGLHSIRTGIVWSALSRNG